MTHSKLAIMRFEANQKIGGGHASRCSYLAANLKEAGYEVTMMTSKVSFDFFSALKHYPRLEPREFERKPQKFDLLVVDHYGLDAAYEKKMRKWCKRICVIDDLANRPHDCDLLIDQTFGRLSRDYTNLVPSRCQVLTGTPYALLPRQYAWKRAAAVLERQSNLKVKSILVSFGASDPHGFTQKSLAMLEKTGFRGNVFLAGDTLPDIHFSKGPFSVMRLKTCDLSNNYLNADLAIGASGVSNWERACLGLPTLIVQTADNQQLIYSNLQQVLPKECFDFSVRNMKRLIVDAALRKAIAQKSFKVCDGWGLSRIMAAMNSVKSTEQINVSSTAGRYAVEFGGKTIQLEQDPDMIHLNLEKTLVSRSLQSQTADFFYPFILRRPGKQPQFSKLHEIWWKKKSKRVIVLVDNDSWILPFAADLVNKVRKLGHDCTLARQTADYSEADVVFFLGCLKLVSPKELKKSMLNLVVHESPLPKGRGFSPMTWQILEGKKILPICLLDAAPAVDSGDIYFHEPVMFEGHELVDELREIQASKTIELCLKLLQSKKFPSGKKQNGKPSYYRRRVPSDSRIDINKSIGEQWNLLRVADNQRYPVFFKHKGQTYTLEIKKKSGA